MSVHHQKKKKKHLREATNKYSYFEYCGYKYEVNFYLFPMLTNLFITNLFIFIIKL